MKRATKKVVSLFTTLALFLSLFGGYGAVYAADVFSVDTLIEAEDTTLGAGALVTEDETASGGKYITSSGDRVDDPASVKNPDVVFTVNIPSDGTYAVYAKVIIIDGGRDSYHFKWDGEDWETVHPGEKGTDYVWLKLSEKALTAGDHMFYWTHRESLAIYDAFFVTADVFKLPAISGGPTSSSEPGSSVDSGEYNQFATEGGSVMFEAEEASLNEDLVGVVESESASGGKGVRMNKDDRNLPAVDAEAGIGFEIAADKTGTYNVWVRQSCMTDGNDSCFMSVNGAEYKDTGIQSGSADENDFKWQKLGTMSLNEGETGSIRIIPRETGAIMDRFIITTNASYMPSGMGGDAGRKQGPR